MSNHSKFAPSSASRWLNCTASFYAHIDTNETNVYAEEGTYAHEIASEILQRKYNINSFFGRKHGNK